MSRMYDTECLECGDPGDNTHPEYPGDCLCNSCYIEYCDQQIDFWLQELADICKRTEKDPYTTEWKLEDY